MALIQKYEETDSGNKRVILANRSISVYQQQSMLYKNKHIFLFDKYTAGLKAEFAAITNYWNQVAQETME